ncbi:uncharacterized protein N7446_003808 [Penicillium canescens]|uniref:FAD-binding PCMH-type domain-containing protein n=1 Tax=Penicillium canescens TaxID=5083 RepID=A0AAD6N403_PENCN|nr:uncharacterized protein N7446_003808 [Penicillium canescens]KAJ6027597.1 hypothetical protein N7460_012414 [Penicillium canescens]KAJ6040875.1 hypothetical protein N7444_009780 [Penicillium canescens]KAJ6066771.1 hypothetical protein N7446_003808 [Penicillium canescens]
MKCQGVTQGDPEYEELRTRYFHARVPKAKPAKIYRPRTTLDVAEILKYARLANTKVGVRSGGHLFACCSLLPDGVLLDTCHLNQGIDYNPQTQLVAFPPGARSKELAEALTAVGRFFPFGHSPTVAAGGFLLAGGQGWFMRGWGCTSDRWVEQMEIVTADGEIVQASKTQNAELFWAARGSGQGFFGVVTRIWGKTIPTRRLWERVVVFDCTKSFSGILHALFELTDCTPKHGVEVAFATFRPDRDDASLGEEVNDRRVFMAASILAFSDTFAEAKTLLSPWESLPEILSQHQITSIPLAERTWNELFEAQDRLNPSGNGERWQCDSILDHPEVDREQLIKAIKPALWDLPTRRSIGCIYVGNYRPDETNQAISIPQNFYIASMSCWTDPSWDDRMSRWMREVYTRASKVSCGQYIADFDANQRLTPVLTDSALQKFLAVRRKWDPRETFIGYRGFSELTTTPASL